MGLTKEEKELLIWCIDTGITNVINTPSPGKLEKLEELRNRMCKEEYKSYGLAIRNGKYVIV